MTSDASHVHVMPKIENYKWNEKKLENYDWIYESYGPDFSGSNQGGRGPPTGSKRGN
jgi:hypothetical protein